MDVFIAGLLFFVGSLIIFLIMAGKEGRISALKSEIERLKTDNYVKITSLENSYNRKCDECFDLRMQIRELGETPCC